MNTNRRRRLSNAYDAALILAFAVMVSALALIVIAGVLAEVPADWREVVGGLLGLVAGGAIVSTVLYMTR